MSSNVIPAGQIYINAQRVTYAEILELTDTVWDDIRIPGLSVERFANAPDLETFVGGTLLAPAFIGTGVQPEMVYFTVQLPHTYKLGTDLEAHVHWAPTTNDAGNVVWQLEYTFQKQDGTFGAPTTINTGAQAAGGTAWVHKLADFTSNISGSSIDSLSAMLVCRFFRDPAHGSDSYGFDASFLEFDLHFEIDTLGSRQETVKRP
jgi:hypothetical protein